MAAYVHKLTAAAPTALLASLPLAMGCGDPARVGETTAEVSPTAQPVEGTSLLGRPLYRPQIAADFHSTQLRLQTLAKLDLESRPDDVEARIWVGRRTAYLGRYREAIDVFTRGLAQHPDEPRLYRHRGHRFITLRKLPEAIADFGRAAALVDGRPDEVEPDGLPNERGQPTSTLKSNIWYHLGLAHYLSGDFAAAHDAYGRGMAVAKNPDMLVAMTYWLHLSARRLRLDDEARSVLEPIHAGLDIIENHAYHRLLLLYRGEGDADELLAEVGEASDAGFATTGYGIGAWWLLEGEEERAFDLFGEIVETTAWASFGYIAAEAELSRAPRD